MARLPEGGGLLPQHDRHSPTTYAATHDLLLVSKLLGHASVETTQRHIAMPDEQLRAAVAATRLAA